MKTLAILAALAAVAAAGPALTGSNYGYGPAYRESIRREKKSPELLNSDVTLEGDVSQVDSLPEARTFGHKKPIIVKEKLGYHRYRDSDEEREKASEDPQEKCMKEVKVKYCDTESLALSSSQMRSAAEDNEQLSKTDIKHSIKMAKEAVENLQKMSQFKKVESGPDAELHEDIEVARQALEHIQRNFGNLESMNLQATTLSEAEALQSGRLQIAKSDSERMAQWKDAMENIQKNAEIARNIEDSFKLGNPKIGAPNKESEHTVTSDVKEVESSVAKSSDEHDSLLLKKNVEHNIDEMLPAASEPKGLKTPLENTSANTKEAIVKLEKATGNTILGSVVATEAENNKQKSTGIETLPHKTEDPAEIMKIVKNSKASEPFEEDLAPASSMPVGQAVLITDNDAANLIHEKNAWQETQNKKILAKSTENIPSDSVSNDKELTPSMEHGKIVEIDTTSLMKSAEHGLKTEDLHKELVPSLAKSTENQVAATEMRAPVQHLVSDVTHKPELKSSNLKIQQAESSVPPFFKSEEHQTINEKAFESSTMKPHLAQDTAQEITIQTNKMKSADHESTQGDNLPLFFKSADHREENMPPFFKSVNGNMAPFFKAANNQAVDVQVMREPESTHLQQQMHESDIKLDGQDWHSDKMVPKTDSLKDADFERDAHIALHSGSPMISTGMHHQVQFRPLMLGSHMQPLHHHHNHMGLNHGAGIHGMKSADFDTEIAPSSQINVNEVAPKAAMDHGAMRSWKQKEVARGAYGLSSFGAAATAAVAAAGASGPGAVGVFPGARVGGCAVPLLLSCSPSVVSGTLAKAPSYAAPHAYKSASNFDARFPDKRDIKKTNEITTKVKRTPTKVIQKIPLDKKL